jgi:hypothetical protein
MVVVPLPNPANNAAADGAAQTPHSNDWLRYAAVGSLVAGGVLLLSGNRKAGLLATMTGATLAMLEQQEAVQAWWLALPGLIDDAGKMLQQAEGLIENFEAQRARIHALVKK